MGVRNGRVYAVGSGTQFDPRRNTSGVHQPEPQALDDFLEASEVWAALNPKHLAWLQAGAPPIHSQEEHIRWFGKPYDTGDDKRRSQPPAPASDEPQTLFDEKRRR
jgi:hypothetical protein